MNERIWPLRQVLTAALLLVACLMRPLSAELGASGLDEFKVKREAVFEFAQKPTITRQGDDVTVRFATKAYCDCTIAIEDETGEIVRHLASGVLGSNAPAPFQKSSLAQTVVWDGKDDQGKYVDDKESHTVRVSLGLKPEFERSLFHDPRKRIGREAPRLQAAPEGVYVLDGYGVQFLRLFDRDGAYVRTVYPVPARSLKNVLGLKWRTIPGIGRWPLKYNYQQASLLTAGTSERHRRAVEGDPSISYANRQHFRAKSPELSEGGQLEVRTFAVQGSRIALADVYLNRLATDGTSGGLPLLGPKVCLNMQDYTKVKLRYPFVPFRPTSSALSPDGRVLYLTGYLAAVHGYGRKRGAAAHVVLQIPFEGGGELSVFAGSLNKDDYGSDNRHLNTPSSVACDAAGRVYVSDYANHRIQIFSPDGDWLKSIRTPMPAKVMVHRKTQEIWVCSFPSIGVPLDVVNKDEVLAEACGYFSWYNRYYDPLLTRFGPFEDPAERSKAKLPRVHYTNMREGGQEQILQMALDSWSDKPSLWVVNRRGGATKADVTTTGQKVFGIVLGQWANSGVRILVAEGGQWRVRTDFAVEASRRVKRLEPPDNAIQRLRVNPANGKVYVLEHQGPRKSNKELIECDPVTGRITKVPIPFRAEDFCFDHLGRIYLRTDREVVRYDARTWREVPWDYGQERKAGFDGPPAGTTAALPIPAHRPMWFHMGGMAVSLTGHLAVVCPNEPKRFRRKDHAEQKWKGLVWENRWNYAPVLYPGRFRFCEIHVWDQYGKVLYEDAVPGLGILDGAFIDRDDNIYTMIQSVRMIDGKPYENGKTGTLIKFTPKRSRLLTDSKDDAHAPIPLPSGDAPKRLKDLNAFWVEGAQWFYGGVGHCMRATGGCNCWHSRFTLDYYARSFAPETERYSVAALDSNGNLIMRIGQYGNVDDEGVGLIYPNYVATDTDRRLFIADLGNARIVSVRLDYHKTERASLKDVADDGAKP